MGVLIVIYYSAINNCFYLDSLGAIPDGAVPITDERHADLLAAMAAGQILTSDPNGLPITVAPPEPSVADIYAAQAGAIMQSSETVARAVKVPYSPEEAQTWWCQYHEAEEWMSNPSYVPVMLNAMVAASAGVWTLSDLAASILVNTAEWKAAAGNILGQRKAKIVALEALRDSVIAGTATLADLQAFDTTITPPIVNLEDKF